MRGERGEKLTGYSPCKPFGKPLSIRAQFFLGIPDTYGENETSKSEETDGPKRSQERGSALDSCCKAVGSQIRKSNAQIQTISRSRKSVLFCEESFRSC